jgi:hypothetical protein
MPGKEFQHVVQKGADVLMLPLPEPSMAISTATSVSLVFRSTLAFLMTVLRVADGIKKWWR